jgi:RNA polymerase primary sigma factor
MLPVKHPGERRLVADVIKGDQAAISRFLDLVKTPIWTTVVALVGDGPPGEKAFLTIIAALRADGFSRLARYDGRSTLSTFLTFVSRDVLGEGIASSFSVEPNGAWRMFERFFGAEIRRRIGGICRKATKKRDEEDLYQHVCLKLVERDYYRIRAFDGRGSFRGYILSTADHVVIDRIREEDGRGPRLPADIAQMSALHQAIFVAGAWNAVRLDVDLMLLVVKGKIQPEPRREEVVAVLNELAGRIATTRGALAKPREISIDADEGIAETLAIASSSQTAEDTLLEQEEERTREALLDAIRRKAETLPNADRLYLQLIFQSSGPLPPREVAKLMAIPADEVYRLKQRVERWVKQIALSLQNSTAAPV